MTMTNGRDFLRVCQIFVLTNTDEILTNDKKLKQQEKIKIYSTGELVNAIQIKIFFLQKFNNKKQTYKKPLNSFN